MQTLHGEIIQIMTDNRALRKRLIDTKPRTITRDECNDQWKQTLKSMDIMAKHPLLFSSARPKPLCNKKYPKCRPRVYFDIRIGNKKNLGNLNQIC